MQNAKINASGFSIKSLFLAPIFFFLGVTILNAQDSSTVFHTDSSIIRTKYWGKAKSIFEDYKNKDLLHYLDYFDFSTIERESYTKKNGRTHVGISKIYNRDGSLKLVIDNDKRELRYVDSSKYPHIKLLSTMKLKADSIICEIYSKDFLEKHLKWNLYNSIYWSRASKEPNFTVSWLKEDMHIYKPTEFYVMYDYFENGEQKTERVIRLLMNLKGKILNSHNYNNTWEAFNVGLEEPENLGVRKLQINRKKAIEIACKNGLKVIDTQKVKTYLNWDGEETYKIYNGKFLYVLEVENPFYQIKNKPKKLKNSKSEVTYAYRFYDTWLFDPWTGDFIKYDLRTDTIQGGPSMLFFNYKPKK